MLKCSLVKDVALKSSTVLLMPREIFIPQQVRAVQPMTGLVFWENHGEIEDSREATQLEFAYVSPRSIAKDRDSSKWDWREFNALLERIKSRDHQAIIRFYYTYPAKKTKPTGVPSFITERDDYEVIEGKYKIDGKYRKLLCADWTHPELQNFHLDFFTEFARLYDDDNRIAYLQMGFGLWAEYHIDEVKMGASDLAKIFPSLDFQKKSLRHMQTQLKKLRWSISIDSAYHPYGDFDNNPGLLDLNFGNFDDSFMVSSHSGYNHDRWKTLRYKTRYKENPHGGELGFEGGQINALDNLKTFERMCDEYHMSYMVGSHQRKYGSWDQIREASLLTGYRFQLASYRVEDRKSFITVKNRGVAPIYYDARVAINGVEASESLSQLAAGESGEFEVAAGGPSPSLTIECKRLLKSQRIQLEPASGS